MKYRNLICAFLGAAAIVALSSCSDTKPDPDTTTKDQISFKATVYSPSLETRGDGSLDSWNNTPVYFAKRTDMLSSFTEHWDASITLYGLVVFAPIKTYGAGQTYSLKGYYPKVATLNANPDLVDFEIDGTTDVMVSDDINPGTLNNQIPSPSTVTFRHLLSQFRISIENDEANPYPTALIKKMKIYAADSGDPLKNTAQLDLTTDILTFGPLGGDVVIYEGAGIPIAYGEQKDLLKTMIEPGKAVKFYMEYANGEVYDEDIVLPSHSVPQEGYSYEIRLKFSGVGFVVEATNTAWITVPSGNIPPINNPW